MSVAELAARVTEDGGDVDRTRAAVYHVHAPLLADCGLVTFDSDANSVAPGPATDGAVAVLDAAGSVLAERTND